MTGLICLFCLILSIKYEKFSLMLVAVGGVVNFSDRIRFNYVRDYWNLSGTGIYNNINDWIIVFGVILFLLEYLWIKLR